MDITGRKLFVKALEEEGVDTIFGYPGGTVTDLFDELYIEDRPDSPRPPSSHVPAYFLRPIPA